MVEAIWKELLDSRGPGGTRDMLLIGTEAPEL